MKKQWMAVALSAGLSQMAMAAAYKVDFEGFLSFGTRTVDCPPQSPDCVGFSQDLAVLDQPFSMSFTFEIGASSGATRFSTVHNVFIDPIYGRSYDSRTAVDRYANWVTSDPNAAQVPALPFATSNPFDGAEGVTHQVLNSATRYRNVRSWTDNQQVRGSSESWNLTSSELWQGAGDSGFQSFVSLGGGKSFSGGTVDNYDDREPLAYFLGMLQQGTACQSCINLQWWDWSMSPAGLYSSVNVSGSGRLVSITEIAAAVPEPSTYALMLVGVATIGFVARRRHAAQAIKP